MQNMGAYPNVPDAGFNVLEKHKAQYHVNYFKHYNIHDAECVTWLELGGWHMHNNLSIYFELIHYV